MAASYDLIPAIDHSAWITALQRCGDHDVYHLPQYHLLAEELGEGKALLFFFQCNGMFAALPFLLRPVTTVGGLENSPYNDISSVYGYPGAVTSVKEYSSDIDVFREAFQVAFKHLCEQLSVISFFSRTNPILPTTWLFKGMAEILPLSLTVAIDLSLKNEDQLKNITKGHKYDIRKARRLGVVVEEDRQFRFIDEFIRVYNETMKRNCASNRYFFPKEYYLGLKEKFGDSIRLYFARLNGQTTGASMFFMNGKIIQYHLSGTPAEFLNVGGAKLILDEIRQLGSRIGFSWLHLGGGVGSTEDGLFRFKAGFSKLRQPYEVLRMIVDQKRYSELCEKHAKWAQRTPENLPDNNFFPDYRNS